MWKGKNRPRKCKGQRRSPKTERHQGREGSMVFAPVSPSWSAAKCQRQSKCVQWASALSVQDCGLSNSIVHVSGTHKQTCTSVLVRTLTAVMYYPALYPNLDPNHDLNPILTSNLTLGLNPQISLWRCEDQQKCPHFASRM